MDKKEIECKIHHIKTSIKDEKDYIIHCWKKIKEFDEILESLEKELKQAQTTPEELGFPKEQNYPICDGCGEIEPECECKCE